MTREHFSEVDELVGAAVAKAGDDQHVVDVLGQRQRIADLGHGGRVENHVVRQRVRLRDEIVAGGEQAVREVRRRLLDEQHAQVVAEPRHRYQRVAQRDLAHQHTRGAAPAALREQVERARQRGPAQVGLDQDHLVARERERRGEVEGDG